MSRYVRLANLTVFVSAALALGASPAQAIPAEFSWAAGTTTLTGSQDGEQIITTTAGEIKCNTVTMSASVTGTSATSIITTSITYTDEGKEDKCRGPLGTSPSIKMNGCQYRLNAGTTLGEKAKGESEGTMDIVNCATGTESITTEAIGCTLHIFAQNGIGPFVFKTIAGPPEHITVESKANNIKYVHTGSLCGNGEGGNGTYTGGWTFKGNNGNATVT